MEVTAGVATTYDALGRATLASAGSELDTLNTVTGYASGLRNRCFAAPEGVNVAIARRVRQADIGHPQRHRQERRAQLCVRQLPAAVQEHRAGNRRYGAGLRRRQQRRLARQRARPARDGQLRHGVWLRSAQSSHRHQLRPNGALAAFRYGGAGGIAPAPRRTCAACRRRRSMAA